MSETDNEEAASENGMGEDTEPEDTSGETLGEDTEPESGEPDIEALKEQLAKKSELNVKLFERAKKAEGFVKDDTGNWVKKEPKKTEPVKIEPVKDKELSAKDAIVLMKAEVDNDEDIDEVVRYAKFQNISISKALESKTMKTILAERKEERQTAEAANTKGGRRGSAKVSEATLLDNARKGQFPDDPAELAKARFASKFSK